MVLGQQLKNRLVILYGVGGLSDVGRHAILAALERSDVEHVTVLTQHPELLGQETRWNCGCETPHVISESDQARLTIVPVKSWKDDTTSITPHFQGATAVISCLGNRQSFTGHWVSAAGNEAVIRAMQQTENLHRVVICSSVGIEEDWPPLEFFKPGYYILSCLFMSFSYFAFRDLTKMERAYKATAETDIDYLLVRPVGIGEDVKPVNKWVLQKKKYEDVLHFDMAKLDCARYMVEEAIHPTRHREAVVIGAEPRGMEENQEGDL
jgi:NAD(P)H-binding